MRPRNRKALSSNGSSAINLIHASWNHYTPVEPPFMRPRNRKSLCHCFPPPWITAAPPHSLPCSLGNRHSHPSNSRPSYHFTAANLPPRRRQSRIAGLRARISSFTVRRLEKLIYGTAPPSLSPIPYQLILFETSLHIYALEFTVRLTVRPLHTIPRRPE